MQRVGSRTSSSFIPPFKRFFFFRKNTPYQFLIWPDAISKSIGSIESTCATSNLLIRVSTRLRYDIYFASRISFAGAFSMSAANRRKITSSHWILAPSSASKE